MALTELLSEANERLVVGIPPLRVYLARTVTRRIEVQLLLVD
jgi:hypothetical protein